MSRRRRAMLVAGATAGVVGYRAVRRARRRERLRQAGEGIEDVLGPPPLGDSWMPPTSVADEAHAPGHQHLQVPQEVREQRPPAAVHERPFAKHRHGLRHPGRG